MCVYIKSSAIYQMFVSLSGRFSFMDNKVLYIFRKYIEFLLNINGMKNCDFISLWYFSHLSSNTLRHNGFYP